MYCPQTRTVQRWRRFRSHGRRFQFAEQNIHIIQYVWITSNDPSWKDDTARFTSLSEKLCLIKYWKSILRISEIDCLYLLFFYNAIIRFKPGKLTIISTFWSNWGFRHCHLGKEGQLNYLQINKSKKKVKRCSIS